MIGISSFTAQNHCVIKSWLRTTDIDVSMVKYDQCLKLKLSFATSICEALSFISRMNVLVWAYADNAFMSEASL